MKRGDYIIRNYQHFSFYMLTLHIFPDYHIPCTGGLIVYYMMYVFVKAKYKTKYAIICG